MDSQNYRPRSTSDRLAYWYFRLNGFLTIENFAVHDEEDENQHTDADLYAVRFGNREENFMRPMEDDPKVAECDTFVNLIFAEITRARECKINDSWKSPENMKRMLRTVGCLDISAIGPASRELSSRGIWVADRAMVRVFAVAEERAELHIAKHQQLTWNDIIDFCIKRHEEYELPKSSVDKWTQDGKDLRHLCVSHDPERRARIRRYFNLRD